MQIRLYSKLSGLTGSPRLSSLISPKSGSLKVTKTSIHPTQPARTRFAPSPTGYLHLGSLRTALYNYLLAKNTGGQFLLRLEDTDQTRLVPDAEQNIYDTLEWCGIIPDESPIRGGPYEPYSQSSRKEIYAQYAQELVNKGHAYYCDCSKDRLLELRESAAQLKPPTTVSYDRKCLHHPTEPKPKPSIGSVIRFKSPDLYEPFTDLVHGKLDIQPQYNVNDRRYDDFVIMKSDGLPTYHFANVVDDHLMKITHVIRGEEWLPSTPKHIAMYRAFGWQEPKFVHIPLLTSLEDKKLSKRLGDIGILTMKDKGILPEAVINFVALFGWSAVRDTPGISSTEVMQLSEIINKFSLDNLTRGNAKVNDSKLYFFNRHHMNNLVKDDSRLDELVCEFYPKFQQHTTSSIDKAQVKDIVREVGPSVDCLDEIFTKHSYLYESIDYTSIDTKKLPSQARDILECFQTYESIDEVLKRLPDVSKKHVFQSLRYALAGGTSGLTIPILLHIIGKKEYQARIKESLKYI
ncbi:tRNA synthetases class I, catalytic domain-containing protein [Scheffersomyces amazonensis]|uniref:tRNA synthetases class I, catalytic domain-containing protein n=1 Tax=Scheffersomyces amazonensis TaxID=1078765 RepID=UPI00315DDAD5